MPALRKGNTESTNTSENLDKRMDYLSDRTMDLRKNNSYFYCNVQGKTQDCKGTWRWGQEFLQSSRVINCFLSGRYRQVRTCQGLGYSESQEQVRSHQGLIN